MSMPHDVWVLADDRTGDVAQAMGVAEALGLPFVVKEVRYTGPARLHNLARGATLLGVTSATRKALRDGRPRLVIGCGRRTAPLARWLKRRSGCRIVQVMDPGWPGRDEFDLVAVPRHDGAMPSAANIVPITGAPHRVTPQRLAAAAAQWHERLAHLPGPRLAVLVGGNTKDRVFTRAQAAALAEHVGALAQSMGASLLVTTSRRTSPAAAAELHDRLPDPKMIYRWQDGGDNPFFGFLALADALVVTGDSVSMCSEACATRAPVYIFALPGMVAEKHRRFLRTLQHAGMARDLPADGRFEPWTHPPLNPAGDIAAAIRHMLAGDAVLTHPR